MADVDLRELAIDRSDSAQPKVRTRRHIFTRYLFPALLIGGFVSLIAWAARDVLSPPTPVRAIPVLATRAEVRQEGTPLFKAAGWVEPRPTPVRVAALAPGVVERLLVVEDQAVRAGEPVAELVKDDAKLSYERALSDLKLREAEVQEAQATATAARTRFEQPVHLDAPLNEADVALAQIGTQLKNLPHEIRRAEASLALAQRNLQVKTESKGVVSGLAVEQARSELDSAQALVAELRERTGALQKEERALTSRRDALKKQRELLADEIQTRDESAARLSAARSRVEQARLVVAEAKLRLDRMTLRAPVDGRVYRLIGHPGTTLTGGMGYSENFDGSTVITLYRPEMLQIRVDVRFEDIPHISLQQPVRIENAALEKPVEGTVLFTSSLANIQKNTLEVKVVVNNPPPVFRPEMLVDVTFLAPANAGRSAEPSEEMRLYVPQQLVHRDDTGAFVWIADLSSSMARKTPVQTVAGGTNGLVEVKSGLSLVSRVISSGHESLKDGARIQVLGEEQEAPAAATGPTEREHRTMNRLPTPGGTH